MARGKGGLSEKAHSALARFEEANTGHGDFEKKVEDNYDAYMGRVKDINTYRSLDWTHKLTPPYAQHIVETSLSSILEDNLRFKVRPRPKFYTPEHALAAAEGAKAMEWLLGWQLEQTRFAEKQRPFVLQERICGMTVAKVSWKQEVKTRNKLEMFEEAFYDDDGSYLGMFPKMRQVQAPEVVYDGPDIEVVDIRDFFWDMSAMSWEKNEMCGHRIWITPEEVKRMASEDIPEKIRWKNTEELTETRDFSGTFRDRRMLDERERGKGRIEVLEIHIRENGKMNIYTIANRSVLLNERESPYWHNEFPFVVISSQPELFKIAGLSQIDKVKDIQRMLWSVSNLRLDATLLATMPIIILQEGVDDPESLKFRPYARWQVPDPKSVTMWSPEAQATQISLPAENALKADMQNLSGGFPFTSASEAKTVDANTATEASLVATLAQRGIVNAKTFFNYGYNRMGQMMIELNQQFIRNNVFINVLGIDDEYEVKEILPHVLQGQYDCVNEPVSDSLLRQERRAEAQTLFQVLLQSAAVFAAAGKPINLEAVLQDLLEGFDKQNTSRYTVSTPQPAGMMGGPPGAAAGPQAGQGTPGGGGIPGMPAFAAQNGGGQTNPGASAGPGSPSTQLSLSPAALISQAMRDRGGGRSA